MEDYYGLAVLLGVALLLTTGHGNGSCGGQNGQEGAAGAPGRDGWPGPKGEKGEPGTNTHLFIETENPRDSRTTLFFLRFLIRLY